MRIRRRNMIIFLSTLFLMVFIATPISVFADEPTVDLGTSAEYAVLAGTTITNTGLTTISGSVGGNIGVHPGTSITGFPPGIVSDGTINSANDSARQAKDDLTTAYNDAAERSEVTSDLTGKDLGGMTLTSGVYSFSSSAQLTGTLTLDAQGDPEAVFIFQMGSTLTTASSSKINLINGARFCRVFWQVGSSATLGSNTEFYGHILASESITANNGATVQGQLLAMSGAVTLDSNTITNGICEVTPTPEPTTVSESETQTTDSQATDTSTTISTIAETTVATTLDNEEIPKTGETNNNIYYGLMMLLFASSIFILRWRRHLAKQQH